MRRLLISLAAACFAAAPAFAQTPALDDEDDFFFDRACMDDYGRDLCDQGKWSEIVTNLGLEPAEQAQRAGLRGVRVFTVDGYSRDLPAITILAAADSASTSRDPGLVVYWEKFNTSGTAEPATLARTAPPELWRKATDLQRLAAASPERQPDQEPGPNPDVISLCLHAWVTVTESLTDAGVLRRVRNACGDDPLFDASFEMSSETLQAFPDCGRINPANHRNAATIVRRCFALDGTDRMAAAEVLNVLDGDMERARHLSARLAPDVRLTLPDRPVVSGAAAVTEALAGPALSDLYVGATRVVGEAGRATSDGYLEEYLPDSSRTASLQIGWVGSGSDWRIATIAIGPLETER